jgi:predicted nucleic acid-binding protein
VKLAGEQLVLDTNILLHLLRGKKAAEFIERKYGISSDTSTPSPTEASSGASSTS